MLKGAKAGGGPLATPIHGSDHDVSSLCRLCRIYRAAKRGRPALSALFFPAAILYPELLLRAFDRSAPFFDLALLPIALFSIAAGLVIWLLLDLLPWKTAGRIAGGGI